MSPTPLELCEDFVLHIPPRLDLQTVVTAGYACVPRGPGGTVVFSSEQEDPMRRLRLATQLRHIARSVKLTVRDIPA